MKKIIISIILANSISGCATKNMQPSDSLNENEGILYTSTRCDANKSYFYIYKIGAPRNGISLNKGEDFTLKCNKEKDTVYLTSVPEGKYYIGGFYILKNVYSDSFDALTEDIAPKFEIKRGKINYIGHIEADSTFQIKKYSDTEYKTFYYASKITAKDLENISKPILEERFPWAYSSYEYSKSIASSLTRKPITMGTSDYFDRYFNRFIKAGCMKKYDNHELCNCHRDLIDKHTNSVFKREYYLNPEKHKEELSQVLFTHSEELELCNKNKI